MVKPREEEKHRGECPIVECGVCKEVMPRKLLLEHKKVPATLARHLDLVFEQQVAEGVL
jgi:hypothetical protein